MRKHLLEYDDVMNKQRENIYALRRQLLESKIQLEDEPEPVGIAGLPDDGRRGRPRQLGRRVLQRRRRSASTGTSSLKDGSRATSSASTTADLAGVDDARPAQRGRRRHRVDQRHRGLRREGRDGRQGAVPAAGRRPAAARARGAPRRDRRGAGRSAAGARRPRHARADLAQHHAADRRRSSGRITSTASTT